MRRRLNLALTSRQWLILGGGLALAIMGVFAWQHQTGLLSGWRRLQVKAGWVDQQEQRLALAQELAPQLTEAELRLLNQEELGTEPFAATPHPADFERVLSPKMQQPNLTSTAGPYHRYLAAGTGAVAVDPTLPAPKLELRATDDLNPEVRLDAGEVAKGRDDVRYYVEFDTTPSFDSPNFWRYPALIPLTERADLTGKDGLGYQLFSTPVRGVDGRNETIRFPFRVTSMALPLSFDQIDFDDFAKFAQLIAHGVPAKAMIREFYNIGRYRFVWASDEYRRSPLDTFKAGLGECAYVNNMIGAMLEMNGYRYRMVAGFNPLVRQILPAGGHSAIEVYNQQTGRWEYLDPYLDVYEPGVATAQFADHPIGATWIYDIDNAKYDPAVYGDHLSLAGLFRFRRYGDIAQRVPTATMLRLGGEEARYGLDWPLRQAGVDFDLSRDLPEQVTIHVRGRYVLSRCPVEYRGSCADPDARASLWQHAQFTIAPRSLLTHLKPAES